MSSISASLPFPRAALERSAVNPWIIAITVTLATFMELDTAIANTLMVPSNYGLGEAPAAAHYSGVMLQRPAAA